MLQSLPIHWFNQTISTQRVSRSVDAGGSPVMTYATNLSGVSCRIVDRTTTEQVTPGRVTSAGFVSIYVDGVPDIVETDRAIWTDADSTQHIFDVQAVNNPDKANVYLLLQCVEVKGDVTP